MISPAAGRSSACCCRRQISRCVRLAAGTAAVTARWACSKTRPASVPAKNASKTASPNSSTTVTDTMMAVAGSASRSSTSGSASAASAFHTWGAEGQQERSGGGQRAHHSCLGDTAAPPCGWRTTALSCQPAAAGSQPRQPQGSTRRRVALATHQQGDKQDVWAGQHRLDSRCQHLLPLGAAAAQDLRRSRRVGCKQGPR